MNPRLDLIDAVDVDGDGLAEFHPCVKAFLGEQSLSRSRTRKAPAARYRIQHLPNDKRSEARLCFYVFLVNLRSTVADQGRATATFLPSSGLRSVS
jgi:hypothetical protein